LATKTAVFSAQKFCISEKNKIKVGFGCEKSSFWEGNTETAGQNYFFGQL